MTHLKGKKFVCPFCGYASNILSRTENHIYKTHPEPNEEELFSENLHNGKNDHGKDLKVTEDVGKCDSLKFNNVKIESKTIKIESRDNLTDKSSPIRIANSPNSRNVYMNSAIMLNKCVDLHAKEVKVCGENNAKIISELDYNVSSVKEEIQTLNENVTVKEERHTDIEYDICDDITTFKEEIPMKFECNDDDNITSVQEEVETNVKFDDNSFYTKDCGEIQNQYSKSDIFDDKQKLHSLFDFARMENGLNEFNENISQETKIPSCYSDDSDSFTGNDSLEAKPENSNKSDKKKNLFEVIKKTNAGTSTFIFKSLECPYSCLSKYKIIQHCRTHEKNKTYKCIDCDFSAKCLFLLKLHKKSHTENLVYCSSCPFVTKSVSTLRKHKYVQHPTSRKTYVASKLRKKSVNFKSFECNICPFKTTDSNKYREHMKIHFRNKTKLKARSSSRSSTLARVSKISEGLNEPNNKHTSQISKTKTKRRILVKEKFKCDICKYFAYSMKRLANHKNRHVKSESTEINNNSLKPSPKDKLESENVDYLSQSNLGCINCPFTTTIKIDFLKHKQVHMPLAVGLFKCTECEFSASKYKVLVAHLRTHAYKYLYKCIHCNFSSNNKATLKSHKENHKNPRLKTYIRHYRGSKCTVKPRNSQVFKCFRCDYSCVSEHLLNQHSLSHFENKLLKCADCDYETNFKGNLVKHVLTHVSEYI